MLLFFIELLHTSSPEIIRDRVLESLGLFFIELLSASSPGYLLRFVIFRRPVSKPAAVGITAAIWFIELLVFGALGILNASKDSIPNTALGAAAIWNFCALVQKARLREASASPKFKAKKVRLESEPGYVSCSICNLKQFGENKSCQGCGYQFEELLRTGSS